MRVLARHPGGHAMRPFCPVVAVATIFAGGGMSSDGRGVGSWNFPTADVRPVIATSGDRARHVRGVAFRTRDERRAEEALNLELRFPPMTAGPAVTFSITHRRSQAGRGAAFRMRIIEYASVDRVTASWRGQRFGRMRTSTPRRASSPRQSSITRTDSGCTAVRLT